MGVLVDGECVRLVPGDFEEVLRPERPVALAHVDADWYASVRICLERIRPSLSPGGVVVLDDYRDHSGCAAAVDEFLEAHPGFSCVEADSSLVLRRDPVPDGLSPPKASGA